jgi:cytochrome P450
MFALKWQPSARACPINLPVTPYGQLLRLGDTLERRILDWASRKRGRLDARDLLSIVVNNPEEDGCPVRDATIVGMTPQLFGAVFETCQSALIWTLVLLAQHPRVAQDLLAELRVRFADGRPTFEGVIELPLLDAVTKESMRVLPPVPMQVRVAEQDTSLAGQAFPRGSRVMLSAVVTNRMPEIYPEPDSFRPERWAAIAPTPFEYLVFSAGPRSCPGYWLGTAMVKAAIAVTFLNYRAELDRRYPVDYRARPGLRPRGAIRATLRPQDGAFAPAPVTGNIRALVPSLH